MRILLLSAAAALLLSGCRDYEGQFASLCRTAKEIRTDPAPMDAVERVSRFEAIARDNLSGGARKTFEAAGGSSVSPDQKYAILQEGAAELGVKHWKCEELRQLYVERDDLVKQREAQSP